MKKTLKKTQDNPQKTKKYALLRTVFWFVLGAVLGLFFFACSILFYYRSTYKNLVYPGVFINGADFTGKTKKEVFDYFEEKNKKFSNTKFVFKQDSDTVSFLAKDISLGYDSELLSSQAFSIGRQNTFFSALYLLSKAYINGVYLPPSYKLDEGRLEEKLSIFTKKINSDPVNAEFTFSNGRVTEFKAHKDGKKVDIDQIQTLLKSKTPTIAGIAFNSTISITLPIKTIPPKITTENVNNLGIKELLATGTSFFKGSIENRIYNINLATSRLNGVLIKPGETFSFAETIGDISTFTGYKQAYVIQNGRTVLGDGGGVCQVSTTLFRAILNAGLPIVERNPHAYRVSYYEQDQGPGIDAAVYVPSVDLKFKNDTKHHILIQTAIDSSLQQLTYSIYGTSDGREVSLSKPVILSQSPAPEPLYQDDPNLPKGTVKQVDFAASGAKVYFTREVKRDGKIYISEKFTSNYRPWQAVYLRGTKEG